MRPLVRALQVGLLLVSPASVFGQGASQADNARDLDRLRVQEQVLRLPSADSVTEGPRSVPAGSVVDGTVVARGPVDVFGTVRGSAVSLAGNVTVHRGGVVEGDAISVGGVVRADSGIVNGEMRSMASLPSDLPARVAVDARTPMQRTLASLRSVTGSFAILLVVALGVVLFAGRNLDEVVTVIEGRFAHAFWIGVLSQLVALPALVVLLLALAVSLIGILLIPFAIVAYAIAVAGLLTLGFLATARLVGGALSRNRGENARAHTLIALGMGIAAFFALWIVAALVTWAPLAASVIRAAAFAATWVAMTLGLGAAMISRAGTHRRVAAGTRPIELASWQTPTPVTGVIAARRTAGSREAR